MTESARKPPSVLVPVSDLEKIMDAVSASYDFLSTRDNMNAILHLAGIVRFSPLTTKVSAELERLSKIMDAVDSPEG